VILKGHQHAPAIGSGDLTGTVQRSSGPADQWERFVLSSTFLSVSAPRWVRYAVVLVLAAAGLLAAPAQAAAQSPPTCGDRPIAADIDAGLDTVRGCNRQASGATGPYSIALMVENAGWLRPQEQTLATMLGNNGHTVTPFTADARPIVNAVNNPTIDLLLFSPSLTYTDRYHLAQRNSLPMLDMSKYSWYRRYVLPWNNEIAGPRFSGTPYTSRRVVYTNPRVVDWNGRRAGPVRVLRTNRSTGEAPMRRAINHSTRGDAHFFLRHVSDRRARSAIGVYLPAGSTVTRPAPTRAEERRRTSRAPWVGLILFDDDFGDGRQYAQLTPAGRSLVEAAMARLMNP
jgi:hypothetical protein